MLTLRGQRENVDTERSCWGLSAACTGARPGSFQPAAEPPPRCSRWISRPAVTRRALLDSHTMSHELAIILLSSSPLLSSPVLARNKWIHKCIQRNGRKGKKKKKKKERKNEETIINALTWNAATVLHQTDGGRGEHASRGARTHTHTHTVFLFLSFPFRFLFFPLSFFLSSRVNRPKEENKEKKKGRARARARRHTRNFYRLPSRKQVFFTRALSSIPAVYRSSYVVTGRQSWSLVVPVWHGATSDNVPHPRPGIRARVLVSECVCWRAVA